MPIPSYLKGFAADVAQHGDHIRFILRDSLGGESFRVYAYAELCRQLQLYTDTKEGKSLFVAQSVLTNEKITLFDNAVHGYDNMFVNENKQVSRLVSELPFSPCRVMVAVSCEIDYEEEKETFEFNSDGLCILTGGRKMPWEQVKTDGIDWISLCYEDSDGSWVGFADEELS